MVLRPLVTVTMPANALASTIIDAQTLASITCLQTPDSIQHFITPFISQTSNTHR